MSLTTLAAVKAYLGITAATQDALLAALIDRGSAFAESYCGRTIASTVYSNEAYDYKRDGNGRDMIFLRQVPVITFSSLSDKGTVIDPTNYVIDTRVGIVRLVNGLTFSQNPQAVLATYTAGFASTPVDLEGAVIELVASKFKLKDRIGLAGQTIAGESISYSIKDIPDGVKAVLDIYKRPLRM